MPTTIPSLLASMALSEYWDGRALPTHCPGMQTMFSPNGFAWVLACQATCLPAHLPGLLPSHPSRLHTSHPGV